MEICVDHKPELYEVDDAQVRCLLYTDSGDSAGASRSAVVSDG